jgi:hypothetical protein
MLIGINYLTTGYRLLIGQGEPRRMLVYPSSSPASQLSEVRRDASENSELRKRKLNFQQGRGQGRLSLTAGTRSSVLPSPLAFYLLPGLWRSKGMGFSLVTHI